MTTKNATKTAAKTTRRKKAAPKKAAPAAAAAAALATVADETPLDAMDAATLEGLTADVWHLCTTADGKYSRTGAESIARHIGRHVERGAPVVESLGFVLGSQRPCRFPSTIMTQTIAAAYAWTGLALAAKTGPERFDRGGKLCKRNRADKLSVPAWACPEVNQGVRSGVEAGILHLVSVYGPGFTEKAVAAAVSEERSTRAKTAGSRKAAAAARKAEDALSAGEQKVSEAAQAGATAAQIKDARTAAAVRGKVRAGVVFIRRAKAAQANAKKAAKAAPARAARNGRRAESRTLNAAARAENRADRGLAEAIEAAKAARNA